MTNQTQTENKAPAEARFFSLELSDETLGKLAARMEKSVRQALKGSIADDAGYREAKRKLFAASREALDRNLRR